MGVRSEQRESGIITAVAGASQSGKTASVKQETDSHERLLIWDVRGEYSGWEGNKITRLETQAELFAVTGDIGPGRYSYFPLGDDIDAEFKYFCKIAYQWGQLWPCSVIADEISDVTSPGKAPKGWGDLLRKGKYWGMWIYGITQFPSESDKTIWRNADVFRSFRIDADMDRDYMAKRMALRPVDLPLKNLDFTQRRAGTTDFTQETLTFKS